MTTIISHTVDSIIQIAIQYIRNSKYNLGLFKDEVYGYFTDASQDLGIDYRAVDDGYYESLYGWEDMLGAFGGRHIAIRNVQSVGMGNTMFILASDYNEDTAIGDMAELGIKYALQ